MFTNLSNLKKAGLFYVLLMALNIAQILVFRVKAPEAESVVFTHMFTPLLMTLIMLFVVTRDGYEQHGHYGLGLRRLAWRSWGLALLLPLLVLTVSYGLAWLSGAATATVPADSGGPLSLLIKLIPTFLFTTFMVLSEEIGFRGYMLPKLLDLGATSAVILSGFLHGVWHLPLMLLIPAFVPEGNLLISIPIFLVLLTASGVVTGVLRLVTDSIWPSTILHGAFNTLLGVFATITVMNSPNAIYLVGESGLLTVLATAAVALWLLQRRQKTFVAAPVAAIDEL